jgi:hypothetical protein
MDETRELPEKESKPGSKSKSWMLSLICGSYTYRLNGCIDVWYIFIHTYIERENKIILVSLSEGTIGDERGKENVREWKLLKKISKWI